jgi:hypothetical protein
MHIAPPRRRLCFPPERRFAARPLTADRLPPDSPFAIFRSPLAVRRLREGAPMTARLSDVALAIFVVWLFFELAKRM